MSVVPLNIARVSMQMQGTLLLGTVQNGQMNLLKVQQQLSTGDRLNRPSDDPGALLSIESLKRQISSNDNYTANLEFAGGFLAEADSALGTLNGLIDQAKSIAASQLGAGSSSDERAAQAQVVESLIRQAMDLGNRAHRGQAIFGGQNGTVNPFVSVGGGYKYQGTTTQQGILTPTGSTIDYTLSGDVAFGAVSSQVVGYRNIAPALDSNTRLSDLEGAQLAGVSMGPITLTVGSTTTSVDLTDAATAGDVVNILNDALLAAGSDATVSLNGGSFQIAGDSTQAVSFADSLSGTTAADLGITGNIAATTTLTGTAVQPRVTATTLLADLAGGAGIDPTGIAISNGANSATISLAGLTTVEDLLNAINSSGTNVRAEINEAGTGINLFNPLSGTQLRIGENGGTTADDLGMRSLNANTNLADFNSLGGVTPISNTLSGPKGQIVVTRTDGTQFNVQLDGVTTPSQLIAAINGANGNTTVTAALNATGNGITLTDTTVGTGNLAVSAGTGFVSNGSDLGILRTGSGGTLAGTNITFSTDDFRITRRDGTTFTVSLAGPPAVATVQDVLNRINNADGNFGAANAVTASLNLNGNGIRMEDASVGGGTLSVTTLNASEAATQLGINKSQTSAGVIAGDDQNPLQPQGVFSTLTMLRDALLGNDNAGIARAAQLLEADGARAIKARGVVGAREQDISARKDQAVEEKTQLKQALSLLADTDFAEAATRFQQLQTAYQASLQVAQTARNLSLLDFLK
jgi:flagellar hook-associated protein 3 FlgL